MSLAHAFFLFCSSDSRTGTIPEELGRLVRLTILDLSWNEMKGEWALEGLPLIDIFEELTLPESPEVRVRSQHRRVFPLARSCEWSRYVRRKLSTGGLTSLY